MGNQINWGDLFEEWVRGDEPKPEFLARKGLNLEDVVVVENTEDWEAVRKTLPREALTPELASDIWNMVQQWRQKQASDDYKSADVLRLHAKALLQSKLQKTKGPDGKETVTTTLNPSQLRSIADTLDKVQKTQRLALGMSTDNIGLDMPNQNLPATVQASTPAPTANVYPIKAVGEMKRRRQSKLERMECWSEVHDRILHGAKVKDLVRFIQVEKQQYLDVTPEGLQATIYQWIQKRKDGDDDLDERIPTKHLEMIGTSGERVDPLDAANMLFAIHMDRVLLDYEIEKRNKRCLDANTKSLALANDMVRTISTLENDVLRRRLITSEPKNANDTMDQLDRVRRSFEEKWGTTAATIALNPESRRRVFNALDRVRKGNSESMIELLKLNDERAKVLKAKGAGSK